MTTQRNPADELLWLKQMQDTIDDLRRRVRVLEQAPKTYMQVGTVTAWVAGPTCVVTWDGGATSICQKPASYTPTPGSDVVVVVFSPTLELPQIMSRIA